MGAGRYERNAETFSPYRRVTMENSFLHLTFAPDQLGRLASIRLKEGSTELTGEFKLSRYTETPLFYIDSDNFHGIRELFWRRSLSGISPMKEEMIAKGKIAFSTPGYGGSNVGLNRTVTLHPEGLWVAFESVLVNNGKSDEKIAVWLNLQGAPPAVPVIPVAGQGSVPQRGVMNLYHRSFLFNGAGGNSNLPGAAEWAGFTLPGRKVVWVVIAHGLSRGGYYYSWGNQDHRAPIRTVEPVFPETVVKPGRKSASLRYTLAVFPGLENINALCGAKGIEVAARDGKAHIRICSALPVKQTEKLTLSLFDDKGKNILQMTKELPPGKAGTVVTFEEKCSGKAVSGRIRLGEMSAPIFFAKDK